MILNNSIYNRERPSAGYTEDAFGLASSVSALFTIKHNDAVFALPFGTGRFRVKQDSWEGSFGLRVALSCIGNNVVKSIDKHTLDSQARQKREQASREATDSEFGLPIQTAKGHCPWRPSRARTACFG
jgi:uncharacterized protein (TIGR04141 family)